MEQARLHIANWAEIDVYNTKGQAAGKIAFMKNLHGWSEKTENKNETTIKQELTPEMAKAQIELLAPQLLELLESSSLVNQLGGDVVDAEVVEEEKADG